MPGTPSHVWMMYLAGGVTLAAGLLASVRDLRDAPLAEKLIVLGPLLFAVPLAVFGAQHFVQTGPIMSLIPAWIPAHLFFVLMVGACLIAAGLSIATRIYSSLAAFLVAVMFVCFEALMMIPGAVQDPHSRLSWVIVFREFTFCAGALSIAAARARNWPDRALEGARTFVRLELGIALTFYAVQQFLYPAHVPGVPLQLITPAWIPGHGIWTYLTGAVYLAAGLCLISSRQARSAAMAAGAMLLLLLVAVYLPILIAQPLDIQAIDYFFDTLLFCGSVLSIAGVRQAEAAWPAVSASAALL